MKTENEKLEEGLSAAQDVENTVEEALGHLQTAGTVECLEDFFANLDEAEGALKAALAGIEEARMAAGQKPKEKKK